MEKKMNKKHWKILAIIFIFLFIVENMYIGYGFHLLAQEVENTNLCYYDICGEYEQASYEDNVCICYSVDTTTQEYIFEKREKIYN